MVGGRIEYFMKTYYYNVLEETVFEIGKFTINWNLFEHYYQKNNAKPEKIKKLNLDIFEFDDTVEHFRNELIKFISDYNRVIDDMAINEFLFHNERIPPWSVDIKEYLKYKNDDIHNGLLCIYRIRNNLLHGEKEIWTINHQCNLIKAATAVLEIMTMSEQKVYETEDV